MNPNLPDVPERGPVSESSAGTRGHRFYSSAAVAPSSRLQPELARRRTRRLPSAIAPLTRRPIPTRNRPRPASAAASTPPPRPLLVPALPVPALPVPVPAARSRSCSSSWLVALRGRRRLLAAHGRREREAGSIVAIACAFSNPPWDPCVRCTSRRSTSSRCPPDPRTVRPPKESPADASSVHPPPPMELLAIDGAPVVVRARRAGRADAERGRLRGVQAGAKLGPAAAAAAPPPPRRSRRPGRPRRPVRCTPRPLRLRTAPSAAAAAAE